MTQIVNSDSSSADTKKPCVACREQIHADAVICPYCRSHQSPQKWRKLGSVLKWLGGLTAIATILVSTLQLNALVRTTRERAKTVTQLIGAADRIAQAGNYKDALELVKQALELEPGSQTAHTRQVSLAMEWLRDWEFHDFRGKVNSEVVKTLLPIFYRGTAHEQPTLAADALAHIGWAFHLLKGNNEQNFQVDDYFERALELDPDNVFAHVFWGNRCLTNSWRPDYDDNLAKAKYHYAAAIKSDRYRKYKEYVDRIRLFTLRASSLEGTGTEYIVIVHNMRKNKSPMEPRMKRRALEEIYDLILREREIDRLIKAIQPHELLETFEVLLQDVGSYGEAHSLRFAHARLLELAGNTDRAISKCESVRIEMRKRGEKISRSLRKKVISSLARMLEIKRGWLGVIPQPMTVELAETVGIGETGGVFVKRIVSGSPAEGAGIEPGDVILEFDGKPVQADQFRWYTHTALAGRTVKLKILKRGELRFIDVTLGNLEAADDEVKATSWRDEEILDELIDQTLYNPIEKEVKSLGFTVALLTEKLRNVYGINATVDGVLVFKNGRGWKDLQPGDVILQIDQQEVSRPDEAAQTIETARKMGRLSVMLTIQRGDEREAVELGLKTE